MSKAWKVILVLVFVLAGALTAGYLVARPFGQNGNGSNGTRAEAKIPAVVCLGHVDVEGGLAAIGSAKVGRVVEVCVAEGASVNQGDALLKLDDRSAKLAADKERANVESARLKLARAEQDLQLHPSRVAQIRAASESAQYRLNSAKHQLQRQEDLLKINNANLEEVRAAESQVKEQEAQVRAAKERLAEFEKSNPQLSVSEMKSELAAAEALALAADYAVEQHTVRAPMAGTVLRIQTGVGEMVGGNATAAPITFRPNRPLIVRAEVEQEFVRRLEVGQSARIRDESGGDAVWTGSLTRIAGWYSARRTRHENPSAFKDVPTVECIIQLTDPQPPLRIGQRVQVTIDQ